MERADRKGKKRNLILIWELRNGIWNRKKYFFGTLVLVAYLLLIFQLNYAGAHATYLDRLADLFKGKEKFVPEMSNLLELPSKWLLIQLYLAYIIGDYAKQDFEKRGHQIFLRVGNKNSWWFGKCLWNLVTVGMYYLIIDLAVLLVSIIGNHTNLTMSEVGYAILDMPNGKLLEMKALIVPVFVMPVLMTAAVSMLQMLLSFVIGSIGAYAVVLSIYAMSTYITGPQWIGNYGMLCRNELVLAGGISAKTAVMVSIGIIFVSMGIGWRYIQRKDIL